MHVASVNGLAGTNACCVCVAFGRFSLILLVSSRNIMWAGSCLVEGKKCSVFAC